MLSALMGSSAIVDVVVGGCIEDRRRLIGKGID